MKQADKKARNDQHLITFLRHKRGHLITKRLLVWTLLKSEHYRSGILFDN